MSQENVEIVRETYAEWQRGNMKAGVGSYSIPRSSSRASCRMRVSESWRTDPPKLKLSCVSFCGTGAVTG